MNPYLRKLKKRVYVTLDLPEEADEETSRVTMVGRGSLLVENHKGALVCSDTRIRLLTVQGVLSVTGEGLQLLEFSESRAFVRGRLFGCVFDEEI